MNTIEYTTPKDTIPAGSAAKGGKRRKRSGLRGIGYVMRDEQRIRRDSLPAEEQRDLANAMAIKAMSTIGYDAVPDRNSEGQGGDRVNNEPLRAALYIRVSSEEQNEYSPEAQRKALRAFARQNGMEVMPEFIFEDHISGKSAEKRPGFIQMISLAKSKPRPFDAIIVHKLDRFARNKEESVAFKAMLRKKCGIKVLSATEPLGEDKHSVLLESLLEGMAEYFLLNLSEEVKKGMTQKAHMGQPQGFAPLGYKMKAKENPDDKKTELELVPEEAAYIRNIFSMFVDDDMGTSAIARTLNDKFNAKTKKGNPIGKTQINYILRNPVYTGYLRWTPSGTIDRGRTQEDSIVAKAQHEPIVSEEMFQKAQDKLAAMEKTHVYKGRPYTEFKHWLSGLLKCSACRKTLLYKPSPHPAFQCRGYTNAQCNISHHLSLKKAEKVILGELRAAFDPATITDFRFNIKRERLIDISTDELTIKQIQLNKIGDRLERARLLFIEGLDTIDEYKATKKKLEGEQARLTEEIAVLQEKSPEPDEPEVFDTKFKERVSGVVDVLISDSPLDAKIKAIRSIVERIVYVKADKTLEIYYRNI